MNLHQKIVSIAMAGGVLLSMAGVAMAAPAVASSNVNVRSGPGTSYGQVDVLRRNEVVEVTGCRSGWCYIEKAGPDGWVSANYLQATRGSSGARPGVNFSFSFGTPPAPPRVIRPAPSFPDRGGWDRDDRGGRGGWDRDDRRGGRGDWDRRDRDGRDGWYR